MQIPITKPCLGPEEEVAAADAIRSGWLTQGPRVAAFEKVVASYCETNFAVAVSNCTTALHLSLIALGVESGDEVICPSMSFIATANSIRHAGATPVFADVNQSHNIDPQFTESLINDRTKAIMVVHQIGIPVDLDKFIGIGRRHGIPVLEDAACAIGSQYHGKPIGGHTEMACFSFHPRKILTTGDGGIVTTNNEQYANNIRLLRHHGMSVPDTVRHNSNKVISEEYPLLGYNYRMTDVQAAIGIEQMKRLDSIVEKRRCIADFYNKAFQNHPFLRIVDEPEWGVWNYQSYPLTIAPDAPFTRDALMQRLLDRQIATRRGIMLCHREAVYSGTQLRKMLPNSCDLSARTILIPLYPGMTAEEQRTVTSEILEVSGA